MSEAARRDRGKGKGDRPLIEIRLEAVHVALAVAVVVFAGGAWWLVRGPGTPATLPEATSTAPGAPELTTAETEDVSEDLTFFDRLGGEDQSGAGRAGIEPLSSRNTGARRRGGGPSASGEEGYAVQVFAGERQAAEDLARRLAGKGYHARLAPSGEGLARVRVGEFRTRAEADKEARRLSGEEGLSTWIVRTR
jgi:hypothetical protein